MTKKDYVKLADAIVKAFEIAGQNTDIRMGVALTVRRIQDALEQDNPRFDSVRFIEYITDKLSDRSLIKGKCPS